jgi:hypothetical protein
MEPRTFPSELCSTESFIPGMVPPGRQFLAGPCERQSRRGSVQSGLVRLCRSPPSHDDVFGLVGSTVLSARMDPGGPARRHFGLSEVRRGDRAPPRWVCGEIPGDGVLIYFGYPQAHEGDAERAACAGLELVEAVAALKAPVSLQTRAGVATGLVVVGEGSGIRG